MNLSKKIILISLASTLMSTVAEAKHNGNTTPTKYLLTISQIAFHKTGDPAGAFIPYATGTGQYDIAAVSPNSNVGVLTATGTLPQGAYDQIQFTVNKTMTVKASNPSLSDSLPCRTDSAATVISNPYGNNSIDKAYAGSRDGGSAQEETVTVPTGSRSQTPSGMEDGGSYFKGTLPVNFTITSATPHITISFDVTNATSLAPINPTTCFVFPGPPSVTVTAS